MVAIWYLLRILSVPAALHFFFVVDRNNNNEKKTSSVPCLGKQATGPKPEAMAKATALGRGVGLSLIWKPC